MSANVLIEAKDIFLQVGDEIIVIGENTYHIEKLKKIIINGEKVKKVGRKRNQNPVKINLPLTLTEEEEIAPNDKIYIISKT